MNLQDTLSNHIKLAFKNLFNADLETVEFQATRKDFEGDITIVTFPMLRVIKMNPVQLGEALGNYLVTHVDEVKKFNVVKGFLNIVIADAVYLDFFNSIKDEQHYGYVTPKNTDTAIMVEYSSPNTNKPLHLGHIRNNLLGYSVSEILKASGKKVYKTQIINDRGIHICKSMLAYKKYGQGEKPTKDLKGDKLVGNYYVKFDQEYKKELSEIQDFAQNEFRQYLEESISSGAWLGIKEDKQPNTSKLINAFQNALNEYLLESLQVKFSEIENKNSLISDFVLSDFNEFDKKILVQKENFREATKHFNFIADKIDDVKNKDHKKIIVLCQKHIEQIVSIFQGAQLMLLKWEAGDEATVALWKMMNQWVYDGFEITYKNLGVDFDVLYYESDTYLLGKEFVAEGLKTGVFFKKDDGSVWCDLTADGLDEKIVLRADGTAVYITQDIGTAIQRIKDYPDVGGMVYTVGNEQDYHFKVLFLILKKLGFEWAKNLYHLSYGMVDLPSGKMKSREGTVVDADDLIVEMTTTAQEISQELGKLDGYTEDDKKSIYNTIGLGALKYFILKVDPKKRILFDPKESVDFQGNTGPFIQYTYARIQAILRKANFDCDVTLSAVETSLHQKEKELIKQLQLFPEVIQNAAQNHSPALIANYTYDLVKGFNSFYQNVSILGAENQNEKVLRVQLSKLVASTIKNAFSLLGISVPERM